MGKRPVGGVLAASLAVLVLMIAAPMAASLLTAASGVGVDYMEGSLWWSLITWAPMDVARWVDRFACDYYEASRQVIDLGPRGLVELSVREAWLTLEFDPNPDSWDDLVLVEMMSGGGPFCSRLYSGVSVSQEYGVGETEPGATWLRLEGGRYKIILPPLTNYTLTLVARDSLVEGNLVDTGGLVTLRLEDTLASIGVETARSWEGLRIFSRDSMVVVEAYGGADKGRVGVDAVDSLIMINLRVPEACINAVSSSDGLILTRLPHCGGTAGTLVDINVSDSIVRIG